LKIKLTYLTNLSKEKNCCKTYDSEQFEAHLKIHGERQARCAKCEEKFSNCTLIHHYRNCYNFKKYGCVHCNFSSDDRKGIEEHLEQHHCSEKQWFLQREAKNDSTKVGSRGVLTLRNYKKINISLTLT
jgi:hypothetical protein